MILKSFANLLAFLAVSIQYVCARDFNVADFGADGKSETIADAQIQKAIDECSKSGGGEVRIGNGLYNCNCIRLKDGVMLNLDRNAVLKMTPIDGKKPTALILADKVKKRRNKRIWDTRRKRNPIREKRQFSRKALCAIRKGFGEFFGRKRPYEKFRNMDI